MKLSEEIIENIIKYNDMSNDIRECDREWTYKEIEERFKKSRLDEAREYKLNWRDNNDGWVLIQKDRIRSKIGMYEQAIKDLQEQKRVLEDHIRDFGSCEECKTQQKKEFPQHLIDWLEVLKINAALQGEVNILRFHISTEVYMEKQKAKSLEDQLVNCTEENSKLKTKLETISGNFIVRLLIKLNIIEV
jgi:tetratricopeptide (TPR) repeat protein